MGGEIFDGKEKAKFVEPGPINQTEKMRSNVLIQT